MFLAHGCDSNRTICQHYSICEMNNNKPRCVCPTECAKVMPFRPQIRIFIKLGLVWKRNYSFVLSFRNIIICSNGKLTLSSKIQSYYEYNEYLIFCLEIEIVVGIERGPNFCPAEISQTLTKLHGPSQWQRIYQFSRSKLQNAMCSVKTPRNT